MTKVIICDFCKKVPKDDIPIFRETVRYLPVGGEGKTYVKATGRHICGRCVGHAPEQIRQLVNR